jgi:hypothetical protein
MPGGPDPARDPRLAWFASMDGRDALVPSGQLALAADEVSGSERRCAGATWDELIGLVRAFTAVESWAAGAKLGVVAEMIRSDATSHPDEGRRHGDLPDEWSSSLRHELALALSCSVQSAQTTAWLAWEKQARLPGTGALLDDGTLTMGKARAVIETFKYLTDTDAAAAEALIVDQLAGKTYPQVLRLAEQAALAVDPALAERRREQMQKNARVTFFREMQGTAGLSGRDLPPDQALAAIAGVSVRAQEYEASGAFGATPMDALRAYAFLDLLKGTPVEDRIASALALDEEAEIAEATAWANARTARNAAQERSRRETATEPTPGPARQPGSGTNGAPEPVAPEATTEPGTTPVVDIDERNDDLSRLGQRDDGNEEDAANSGNNDGPPPDGPDADHPGSEVPSSAAAGSGPPGSEGPGSRGPGSSGTGSGPGTPPAGRVFQARPPDLVVPLLTLLGRAERPGEIQGFGLLDPALARDMTAAAITSRRTEVCVTVTSPEGYAIGHGCARPARSARTAAASGKRPGEPAGAPPAGLPARLNLTIPATALPGAAHAADLAGNSGAWAFSPRGDTGPPDGTGPHDGYGTWTLVLPDGRRFTVRLDVVPVLECDHRYETSAYQPTARLRHLVQVRDGTCTFPSCSRHARESDFEHAVPYDQGGKTCCCNAGARSRACHRVKQTRRWEVSQPHPGWHQWTTPSGRVYTQGPKRYPA